MPHNETTYQCKNYKEVLLVRIGLLKDEGLCFTHTPSEVDQLTEIVAHALCVRALCTLVDHWNKTLQDEPL